ncbi:hypothetical protein [Acetobacterium sp.]|uniref:hypothetical protein n=1 Tax=Acetobacterium sp. TaxID=1872094 RepID=UPI002F3F21ED
MIRIWGKLVKHNKFLEEKVFEIDNKSLTIYDKIQAALETFCHDFDLEKPKNLIGFPKHLFVKTSLSIPSGLII